MQLPNGKSEVPLRNVHTFCVDSVLAGCDGGKHVHTCACTIIDTTGASVGCMSTRMCALPHAAVPHTANGQAHTPCQGSQRSGSWVRPVPPPKRHRVPLVAVCSVPNRAVPCPLLSTRCCRTIRMAAAGTALPPQWYELRVVVHEGRGFPRLPAGHAVVAQAIFHGEVSGRAPQSAGFWHARG
jgi:hypothetical protein